MTRVAILMVATLLLANPARALEPKRAGQESSLIRAVFAQGRLWMLSDAGELSSIAVWEDSRVEEPLGAPVLDLCARNWSAVVLACADANCDQWAVRARGDDGSWNTETTIETRGEQFIGMVCYPKTVSVLTDARLIDVTDGIKSTLALTPKIHPGAGPPIAVLSSSGDEVLLGLNKGEWGGGLRRIDRATGKVTVVAKKATRELCSGPLNPSCDAVNGIAREPWKPACVAVAVGLVHFVPSGRIVEVCPDRIGVLYSKAYPTNGPVEGHVAFFGIVAANRALWAVGIDGIYRIDESGAVTRMPLPHLKDFGGIRVSFDDLHLVVVMTSANARHSISGNTPMLVWR